MSRLIVDSFQLNSSNWSASIWYHSPRKSYSNNSHSLRSHVQCNILLTNVCSICLSFDLRSLNTPLAFSDFSFLKWYSVVAVFLLTTRYIQTWIIGHPYDCICTLYILSNFIFYPFFPLGYSKIRIRYNKKTI